MKKILRDRKLLTTLGVFGSAAIIGVPAAIVFTTKDNNSGGIGKNISKEIDNKLLDSIDISPANHFGSFNNLRLKDHVDKLYYIKQDINRLSKEYGVLAKTKIPYFGILNDVLHSANRYKTWDDFIVAINKVVTSINNKDWDALELALFGNGIGNANKLLSRTYGVKRSEITDKNGDIYGRKDKDGNLVKKEELSYKVQHSFVSFEEYIDVLKTCGNNPDPDDVLMMPEDIISSILGVINMMLGTSILFDPNSMQAIMPNLSQSKPTNSITYFIEKLKEQKDLNPGAKYFYDIYENQMLPAWSQRFNNLQLFYSPDNEPIGKDGARDDMSSLDAFKVFEGASYKEDKTITLEKTIDSFLTGEEVPGGFNNEKANYIGVKSFDGIQNRQISNWQFLRLFFGKPFEKNVMGHDPLQISPEVPNPTPEQDSQFKKDSLAVDIRKQQTGLLFNFDAFPNMKVEGVNKLTTMEEYWSNIVNNIFDTRPPAFTQTNFMGKIIDQIPGPNKGMPKVTQDTLWWELYYDHDLYQAYADLNDKNLEYDKELREIDKDPFRLGINLDKFNELLKEFDIDDDWEIKVDSFEDHIINKDELLKVKGLLKKTKDGKSFLKHTDDYDMFGGYIYPSDNGWLLRTTDKLFIDKIHFTDNSKLKKWESDIDLQSMYQPIYDVKETESDLNVQVEWKEVKRDWGGVSND